MNRKGYATAHYTSHCHGCDSVIRPGQRIKWSTAKGWGAVHADCPSHVGRKQLRLRRKDNAQIPAVAY